MIVFFFVVGLERESVTAVNITDLARSSARQGTAAGMAVVVNGGTVGGISLIDPVTETTMGPFLSGLLGPASSLLDCVVTPDGTTAIVSNFSAQRLFFIDVRTLPPVLLGSVALPIPAEDLALTPNGRFVLVTDGGGSVGFFTPVVVSVDVASRTVVGQFTSFGFFGAQSVAVARDNRTVVIADFDGGLIVPLRLLSNGSFDMEGGTGTISFNRPANVALAPDGRTGVVCNLSGRSVEIISINGAARTVSQAGSVGGLPGGQQGAVFTPDGTKVLVLSALPGPDQLAILQVEASGAISDTGQRVTLPSDATEAFLGVDVMAVTPEGTKAYIGNPGPGVVTQGVTVVDLTTTTPVVRGMIPMPTPVAIAFPQPGR